MNGSRRRQWQPSPVLLPGKSHGQRSLVGYSPWDPEESDTTERLHFHFHALQKAMATHSSVLAWRIPGTGEPGGLPSMGLHSRTRLKRLSSSSRSMNGSLKFILEIQHFPNTPLENNLLHLHITGRLLKVLATLSPLPLF